MREPMRSAPAAATPNTTHALTICSPLSSRDSLVLFYRKLVKRIKALKQIGQHPLGALGIVSIPRVAVHEKPFLREDADHCPDQQQHPGGKRHERKIGQDSCPAECASGRIDRMPDEAIGARCDEVTAGNVRGRMEAAPAQSEARPCHERDGGHLDRDNDWRAGEERVHEDEARKRGHHQQQPDKRGDSHTTLSTAHATPYASAIARMKMQMLRVIPLGMSLSSAQRLM